MKAKIVVADDEPRIRKMIARLLTDEGYDVMPVENGREAVWHHTCGACHPYLEAALP